MLRRLLLLGFTLCLVSFSPLSGLAGELPKGDARAAGFDPDRLARIQKLFDESTARREVAGGVALIARHGKVVSLVTSGQSDAEEGKPIEADTIFRIASMSKPITSTAVMILVDDGKLKVTDPVSKYLPEFEHARVLKKREAGSATDSAPATVPAEREITVHDLLTHTSGISYRFFDRPVLGKLYVEAGVSDGLSETPGTIGDNVKRLARLPLLFQPGSAWEYGLNTDVLGRLVEVVSGRTLDQFFRERIFEPLRMNDTYFVLPREKRSRLAGLYMYGDDKVLHRVGRQPVHYGTLVFTATYPTWDESKYYSGGAGLVSTLGDYSRFLQMLLNHGELDGARILKPETVAAMTQNQIGDLSIGIGGHGERFGYGFGIVTDPSKSDEPSAAGSFSWGGIFYTYFWADPKNELLGVMMTQVYPSGHTKLRDDFKRLVYEALQP